MSPERVSRSPLPGIFQTYVESGESFTFADIATKAGLSVKSVSNYFEQKILPQRTWSFTPPQSTKVTLK